MSITTKLEAVNKMLAIIGEAPVSSLTSGLPEAEQAETALDWAAKTVCAGNWIFNMDYEYEITPDGSGYITLPTDAISIDPTSRSDRGVMRGTKLWNQATNSFVWTNGTMTFDIKRNLPFLDFPEPIAQYTLYVAAREYQDNWIGSQQTKRDISIEENKAWLRALDYDTAQGNYNLLDNYETQHMLGNL